MFESCTARRERGISHAPVSCAASVAYVTVWARVVGLRASRWACYCVSIVPSRPPGLAGFSVRGGTGRRTGFRFQRLRVCGFDSHRAHWRQVFLAFPLAAHAPLVL